MRLKLVSGIILKLLLIGMLTFAFNMQPVKSESKTWTVDDDGSADFHTIQEAINAASPGDTIFVEAGTYYEHVVVDKTLILVGLDEFNTIIDGEGTGSVVYVTSNRTSITGFTMQKSGSESVSGGNYVNAGIYLNNANYCNVTKNSITNNCYGIWLDYSSNNSISHNHITANENFGICLRHSSDNSISGNSITANRYSGICLLHSSNNVLRNNEMANNTYNFQISGQEFSHFVNDVDASNTVDGKPIYYWVNKQDMTVPLDAGYVTLVNCTNITIQDLNLTHNDSGALLACTTNSTITKNSVEKNNYGFSLYESFNNSIFDNNITQSEVVGIAIQYSSSNRILGNDIRNNFAGIWLYESSGNIFSGNNITASAQIIIDGLPGFSFVGILIEDSPSNSVSENNLENHSIGILLDDSSDINISRNHITANKDYGIWLDYSSNNSISHNHITASNYYGIWLDHSSDNNISRNHIADNNVGIKLATAFENSIFYNNFIDNNVGIKLVTASRNSIFHNNFINNTNQALQEGVYPSINTWDDGCKGNYWSDYTGVDSNNDGIGDTPYVIDKNNQDNYPLIGKLPILADVNNDGEVNIIDVYMVAKAFGSYPGHRMWNPVADVANPYGIIDIVDLYTIAREYGKTL